MEADLDPGSSSIVSDESLSQSDYDPATNTYLASTYAAVQPTGRLGDGQVSVVYDCETGEIAIDAATGVGLTSINIDSAAGVFVHHDRVQNLGGSFDNHSETNIFKATFGGSFGSVSFGNVAQLDWSEGFIANDLTVVGSLSGGGDMGAVDLVYTCGGFRRDLRGVDLPGQDLAGQDYSFADLSEANFSGAVLSGANLSSAVLSGANMAAADVSAASLRGAELSGADLSEVNLSEAFLSNALLSDANLRDADLGGANFNGATLTRANMESTNLHGASLANASLTEAKLRGAVITSSDFRNTTPHGFVAEQLYRTASYQQGDLRGVRLGGNDLTDWNFHGLDLTGASFVGATLTQADFTGATVDGADFGATMDLRPEQFYSTTTYDRADLRGMTLIHMDLSNWDFSGQNLVDAQLFSSDLSGANFRSANLTGAILGGSDLSGANFRDAIVTDTRFGAPSGLAASQLYTTASYQQGILTGIGLHHADLRNWDFAGQDLTGAEFSGANLVNADLEGANLSSARLAGANLSGANLIGTTMWNSNLFHADLSGADLRGAEGFLRVQSTVTQNMIWPNGEIPGLHVGLGETLVIRNFNRPIRVEDTFAVADGGEIEMVLDGRDWRSTLTLRAERQLGGTLRISLDRLQAPEDVVGKTFKLLDWQRGLGPGERFSRVELPPASIWDVSQLYDTGEVTLIALNPPGDANQDLAFDQADLRKVIEAGKYLTGEPATWGEGDWNGDQLFDQLDLVAALQADHYQVSNADTIVL